MFTLAVSFMIFAASSFSLTANLIVQTTEAFIGADIKAQGRNFIDEVPISKFLDDQIAAKGSPVLSYAFQTIDTD
jgi:hypothetical protein